MVLAAGEWTSLAMRSRSDTSVLSAWPRSVSTETSGKLELTYQRLLEPDAVPGVLVERAEQAGGIRPAGTACHPTLDQERDSGEHAQNDEQTGQTRAEEPALHPPHLTAHAALLSGDGGSGRRREKRAIVIVDYDPGWPARFEAERARVQRALGARVLRVEHIGSTAVPGLPARPIIDLLVAVEDPDDDAAISAALESVGSELLVREPGHRMFRTPQRDVHVHIWADMNDYADAEGPLIEDILARTES